MASELRVNTLKDASGNNSVSTSVVAQGSTKAWINFNGSTATATADLTGIRDSFNIASLVDNDTGDYTLNFTNSMANDGFAVGGFSGFGDGHADDENVGQIGFVRGSTTPLTNSSLRVSANNNNSFTATDMVFLSAIISGELE